jgi:hypothetical protein
MHTTRQYTSAACGYEQPRKAHHGTALMLTTAGSTNTQLLSFWFVYRLQGVLFFLGVLMAVGSLNAAGLLKVRQR